MKLLDTSVVIDFLRSAPPAVDAVTAAFSESGRLVTSEITRFEVLSGMHADEEDETEQFFAQLDVYPVLESVARRAADLAQQYRASHRTIEDGDYLIAATAVELNADLLTTNVRHFPMFPVLEPPYRLASES